ncbi:glycosyltransferase, partial [Alcanivorax jadensis]|uniref:glycosyltransferase n=1 Tax=Alcanivorax jadensis TaxID=64988 RepID=UPI00240A76E8
ALARVCRETGARLVLVGATPSVTDELPGIPVEVVPWSEDSEAEQVSRMSVGIMPLEDGPWERGKCGYKLIQYMACAVPVVASPVGVNTAIVGDNECGLLADSSDDWSTALLSLLGSRERRVVLGLSGRHAVDSHYSLQVQAPILRDVLVTACHRKKKR